MIGHRSWIDCPACEWLQLSGVINSHISSSAAPLQRNGYVVTVDEPVVVIVEVSVDEIVVDIVLLSVDVTVIDAEVVMVMDSELDCVLLIDVVGEELTHELHILGHSL
jgi:hypothetical protein